MYNKNGGKKYDKGSQTNIALSKAIVITVGCILLFYIIFNNYGAITNKISEIGDSLNKKLDKLQSSDYEEYAKEAVAEDAAEYVEVYVEDDITKEETQIAITEIEENENVVAYIPPKLHEDIDIVKLEERKELIAPPTVEAVKIVKALKDLKTFTNTDGKYGIIDYLTKEVVVKPTYDHIFLIDNYAIAILNKKYGVIDVDEKVILPFDYQNISPLTGNLDYLIIKKPRGTQTYCGLYKTSEQKLTIPLIYEDIKLIKNNKGSYISACKKYLEYNDYVYKYGLVTLNNDIIIPFEYDWHFSFINDKYDCLRAKKNHLFGSINLNNKNIIPFDYFTITAEPGKKGADDYARLLKLGGGKTEYGLTRLSDGKVILPVIYNSISNIYSNVFIVEQKGKYGLYFGGTEMLPVKYSKINVEKTKSGYQTIAQDETSSVELYFEEVL